MNKTVARASLAVALLASASSFAGSPLSAWTGMGGGDIIGQHNSSATQITPANVAQLKPAWVFRTGDQSRETPELMKHTSGQATPLMLPPEAGEHLVTCTPFSRVIALDPATGTQRWEFDPKAERGGKRGYRCRGVSYWRWSALATLPATKMPAVRPNWKRPTRQMSCCATTIRKNSSSSMRCLPHSPNRLPR